LNDVIQARQRNPFRRAAHFSSAWFRLNFVFSALFAVNWGIFYMATKNDNKSAAK
jgi:hypothetical protein